MPPVEATPTEPDGAPRLPVLDTLRGVAILLILFLNISDMGASAFASIAGDPRRLGWGTADQAAWWTREVLVSGTARALLEMLFGAGMVLLGARTSRARYAWRNLVLVAFGLVHVFVLLWPGDILHSYGLAALVAMLFRGLRPRLLLTIGGSFAALVLLAGGFAIVDEQRQRARVATLEAKPAPTAAERTALATARAHQGATRAETADLATRAAAEDRARSGDARSWAAAAWRYVAWSQARGFELLAVWEATGTMLIGAALFKLGVLQGARGWRFYGALTLAGYGVGLPCRIWAAWATTRFDGAPSLAEATTEVARLATTLGHLGAINLLLLTTAGAAALRPFAAAGRTALTIYIAQTLVCLWVIYPPWGLGLYGQQGWAALMTTALAVDAALLALAVWWTRRFAIAPIEWAWRSVVAGRRMAWGRMG